MYFNELDKLNAFSICYSNLSFNFINIFLSKKSEKHIKKINRKCTKATKRESM